MLRIGLTGGIGSGKTYISGIFRELGTPVYNADSEARRIMDTDPEVRRLVQNLLGSEAYNGEGLNSKYVAHVVFSDKEKLQRLNSIVHPVVRQDFNKWTLEYTNQPYVIMEAAILFESGGDRELDHIVFVKANIETRIGRVIERDNVSGEMVRARVVNQMDDAEKEKRADFVIINEIGSMILPQIVDLHNSFSKVNS